MRAPCPREGCDVITNGVYQAKAHALDHERRDRETILNKMEETTGDELAAEIEAWLDEGGQ